MTGLAWLATRLGLSRAAVEMVLTVALLGGIVALFFTIRHSGERAGEAKITAKVERAHTAAVADARHDERMATNASTAIATSTAQQAVASAAVTHHIIEDLRNAIDAVPAPAAAGAALPAAPVDGLRASLNSGIDRANRAADAADALP